VIGEVSFSNRMRVSGVVKGKVHSESVLEIRPGGKVDAEVNVRQLSVSGELHGVVRASDRVEIHKDGKVIGDIESPILIIEAGGIVQGHCNMIDSQKTIAKKEEPS
jgi:cytoskeletal protein CcmA (bactofilin family)